MSDALASDKSILDEFVERCRTIASGDDPVAALTREMERLVADPSALGETVSVPTAGASIAGFDEIVFEDDSVTVYLVHSAPDVVQPPHDHLMSAVIGVYEGRERHRFFRRSRDVPVPSGTADVDAGDVLALGPSAIHAISAPGAWCRAVHVYLGSLSSVDRTLFDPDTLDAEPMTAERYDAHCRHEPVRSTSWG
ncbi:MAG: hypothetical protein RIB65_13000 [Ilumatobacter fluminis]|uniref:hypothetical protein n=1 Tax=Ilumatobacter fluminis TaxID=467091 RepID=UPI0032ED94AC